MWPYEYTAKRLSPFPVRSAIASELVVSGDAILGANSAVVFTSVTGTSEDMLQAVEYVKAQGALTIGFTGAADNPLAVSVDVPLITQPKAWPFDIQMLLLLTRLLSNRGEFAGYDKLADELTALPAALVKVAADSEEKGRLFAEAHRDTDYHFLIGGGVLWASTYLYSMCVLEEMQWLRTTRVDSAEFFHGSLELLEKDTSVLILQGEDETRPLTERARAFATRISDDVTVFDVKDYELAGISQEFRGLLGPIVLDTALNRVTKHLARVRNHPDDTRRYYRVLDY
jgi:fructoselysine-6-phosphate deglycase